MGDGWDFSCPQYVDFGNLDESLNDNADEWFDIDHETGQRVSSIMKKSSGHQDDRAEKLMTIDEVQLKNEMKSKVLNGLNTPLEQSPRRSPRFHASSNKENSRKEEMMSGSNKKDAQLKTPAVSDMQPAVKKLRQSDTQQKQASQSAPRRSVKHLNIRRSVLTVPRTPKLLKRALARLNSGKPKVKTSEELELEMMKNYRENKQKCSQNQKPPEKSMLKKPQETKPRSVTFHQHTIPKEFNFATDTRIKTHEMVTRQDSPKDFASSLRQQSIQANSGHDSRPKVTHPVPFNFVVKPMDKKSGTSPSHAKRFKSDAEIVVAFHRQTPKRYHTGNPKEPTPAKGRSTEKHMTLPKSPQLMTKNIRKRKISFVGHDKQEELDAEETKKFKFKAMPYDQEKFKFPTGIRKMAKPSVTKPVPFTFEGDKIVRKKADTSEPKFEFHAQPVPESALSGPANWAPVTRLPLTMPKSPAFALKNRCLNKTTDMSIVKPDSPKPVRINHMAHQGVPFKPKLEKKVTVPEPFTFDERDKDILTKKEEKIKEELEASSQVPKFKAQLLPITDKPTGLPEKNPKPPTAVKPFKLQIDSRGEEKADKWKKAVENELKTQRRSKIFKAQPCTVPYAKPFTVKPSQRALTNISAFEMNTDRRATEREELDNCRKRKQSEIQAIHEERQKEAEVQEKMELAKLRKDIVHKALPVMKYKPLVIKKSDTQLTQAESPNFSTRNRSQRI